MTASTRLRRLAPAALVLSGLIAVSGTTGAVAGAMITGANIKDNTVTGADIKDGSLGYADTSVALDNQHRRVGGYAVVRKAVSVSPGTSGQVVASCPAGRSLLGTASWWDGQTVGPQVVVLPYASYTRRAQAYSYNSSGQNDTLRLAVFCGRTDAN